MSTWYLLGEPERPDYLGRTREPHNPYDGKIFKGEKEAITMQVTYNGFTGKLLELKRKVSREFNAVEYKTILYSEYDLSIYDSEKQVTHSFTGVNLEDVKFSGGEVSFG